MALSALMQDQRLTTRLTQYWNTLRGDEPLPRWQRFNAARFGDIWQQCCGWRVDPGQGEGASYTYEFVGSSVKEAVGADLTGKMFNMHFRDFPGARIVEKIDEVIRTATFIIDEGQFVNEKHKIVKYRSCLLPFGQGTHVTNIVMGLSWKAF